MTDHRAGVLDRQHQTHRVVQRRREGRGGVLARPVRVDARITGAGVLGEEAGAGGDEARYAVGAGAADGGRRSVGRVIGHARHASGTV
ncbi:hypothetical protein ACW4TU_03105 [Streptomyces sp. QTS52]